MKIGILFFAAYRDLVGIDRLDIELSPGSTVAELVSLLRGRGAPFKHLPPRPAVALNRVYVRGGSCLSDGDEVAFIPPVAGG